MLAVFAPPTLLPMSGAAVPAIAPSTSIISAPPPPTSSVPELDARIVGGGLSVARTWRIGISVPGRSGSSPGPSSRPTTSEGLSIRWSTSACGFWVGFPSFLLRLFVCLVFRLFFVLLFKLSIEDNFRSVWSGSFYTSVKNAVFCF